MISRPPGKGRDPGAVDRLGLWFEIEAHAADAPAELGVIIFKPVFGEQELTKARCLDPLAPLLVGRSYALATATVFTGAPYIRISTKVTARIAT